MITRLQLLKIRTENPDPSACAGKSAPKDPPGACSHYLKEQHCEKSTISKGLDYQKMALTGLTVVTGLTTIKPWSK